MAKMAQNKKKGCNNDCEIAKKIETHDQTGAFRVLSELVETYPTIKASIIDTGPASILSMISKMEANLIELTKISMDLKTLMMGDGINPGVAKKTKENSEIIDRIKGFFWVIGGALGLLGASAGIIKLFFSR
jgi:hypothetical protein